MSNCRAIVIVWLAICLALSAACATSAPPPPAPPPVVIECPRLPPPPPMPEIRSDYLSRSEKLFTDWLQRLMPLLCRPASSERGSER